MPDYTFRGLRGPSDAGPQYDLWLRATADLPRAWRSCLRNVEQQLEDGRQFPLCRLYAEAPDGTLLGYIGTHPPFDWIGPKHGPPAESLGWTISFGYPWTHPVDESLEAALYDEMIRVTPEVYHQFQRDIYIQRYRESWTRHVSFLEQRGWRRHARVPLLGRKVDGRGTPPPELAIIARGDLTLVSTLCHDDVTMVENFMTEELQQRYDGGWIVSDSFWRLGERGAFALEQRGQWAAVTFLVAQPDALNETLHAAAAQAATLGVEEIYFTVEAHETRRRQTLGAKGFHEVDAGVYYIRDAD